MQVDNVGTRPQVPRVRRLALCVLMLSMVSSSRLWHRQMFVLHSICGQAVRLTFNLTTCPKMRKGNLMISRSHRVALVKQGKHDLRFYVPRHPGCQSQPSAPVVSSRHVANDDEAPNTAKYQLLVPLSTSAVIATDTFGELMMMQLPSSGSLVIESQPLRTSHGLIGL
jgi:hypothetical protein